MSKAGLLEICQIEEGEDLQEGESLDKAAVLLGILLDAAEAIDNDPDEEGKRETWKEAGIRALKYAGAKATYGRRRFGKK